VTRLLVRNAVLLTLDPDRPEPFRGWFAVGDDGRLTAVEPGEPPVELTAGLTGDQVLDVGGALVGPGFVSSHSHLFTSGFRGVAKDESLYGWLEQMLGYTHPADAEDIYWMTRHGAQDFLRNGITTAYDFTDTGLAFEKESAGVSRYSAEVPDTAYQHAQLRAKVDAGLRHVHSVMLAQGDVPQRDTLAQLDEVVAAAATADPALHLGLALSGTVQWAESPEAAVLEVTAMRRHGLLNQPHFLETPYELELQRSKFAWYAQAGALGPDLVFGHFIQTTDEIIATAAAAGCGMSWQPMSNGRLASGVAQIPRIRELGMRVGIGLDDQSCTDISDPFANMRMGLYTARARHADAAVLTPRDVLRMHTLGAAEVLGVADRVGSLEVGKHADLLVVDHRAPSTGPVWDVVATYVLACGLRNLKQVYVGGRLAAADGRCTSRLAAAVDGELHERITRAARSAGLSPAL
jgi:5-methylthioadenosine/S-adenosylhomocysteine deaminase